MKTISNKRERSFPFLRINECERKPRKRGLTEIRGPFVRIAPADARLHPTFGFASRCRNARVQVRWLSVERDWPRMISLIGGKSLTG
jgi:hypothetical protein